MNASSLILILIGLAFIAALFFLFRELFCWYYKINIRVELEKERNELLKKILRQLNETDNIIRNK